LAGDAYDERGISFLMPVNWTAPGSNAFANFWHYRVDETGGAEANDIKRDGSFYSRSNSLMNELCRLTYSSASTNAEKLTDTNIAFDGCACEQISPSSILGIPSFGFSVSVDEDYFAGGLGPPDIHTWEYPTPYFGTQTYASTYYGRNCIREAVVWLCPGKYEDPADAGEDTEYRAGPVGTCTPVCATPTCPPGYTWDPILELCVSDFDYRFKLLDQEIDGIGKRVIAVIDATTGILSIYEYDSALPPALSLILNLVPSDAATCSLRVDKASIYHLAYTLYTAGEVAYQQSRDGGRNWSSPVTIFNDYILLSSLQDKAGGKWVYILFEEATEKLFVATAEISPGGAPGTPNTPVEITGSAYPSADLIQDRAGVLLLAYTTSGGASVVNKACKSLASDGTGTWA
jgi:hypothetical protein